jgi:glycosyltransferase involved in cell wall biosynthesis
MRVCHFIASSDFGGAENVAIRQVNELSTYSHMTIYFLIPFNSQYKARISSNVNILEYKSKNTRLNINLYLELYKTLKNIKVDIVHTHAYKSSYIFYYLNKFLNIKHIATKQNPRNGKIFYKIDNVIVTSKEIALSLNKNTNLIYNGLEPIVIAPKQEKNNIFTIIAIGRLDKIKGFDILIKECSKLKFNFNLNIIGEGPEEDNLSELISNLGMNEKIKLLGFRTDIPELMNSSDIVVVSSLSEGFVTIAVESLYYANVFISTKVGGSTEILTDNLLMDYNNIADKIINIYKDYHIYYDEFKKIKIKYHETFLIKNTIKQLITLYER